MLKAAILLLIVIGSVSCFVTSPSTPYQTSLKATRAPEEVKKAMESAYPTDQLTDALNSLNDGSSNPDYDSRHIYGYKDPDHKLSMLQTITATTILDYQKIMVRASFCGVCCYA